jgi:two-component system OmpR family sensor kinase
MSTSDSRTAGAVRAASRRIGLQAAALVAVVVLALTAVVIWLTDHDRDRTEHEFVVATAAAADDVVDPPPNCWLVLQQKGEPVKFTKQLPAGLPDGAAIAQAMRTGTPVEAERSAPDGHFLVYTEANGADVVQVVLDLGPSDRQQRDLMLSLGACAAVGLVLAGVVGLVLGRRVLAPLRHTMELQRQFVADAAHELRTPLTLLHTRAQLLRRGLAEAPPPLRTEAEGVVRDSRRLGELVEDLLLAADPLTTSSTTTPVDLRQLIDETLDAVRGYAAEREVRVEAPASGDPAVVAGSVAALRRALIALLDNAIEHTPAGGQVTVATHTRAGEVDLVVTDTGTGFGEDPEQLIARFHSGGHQAGRRRYGLGLALVNDIADRHGGRLRAASEPGRGATFTLTLTRFDQR